MYIKRWAKTSSKRHYSLKIYRKMDTFIQIYHVWEGYLRKIPVERRKISQTEWRGKCSLKTGILKNFVSRLVFFANTPPKHDISV